MTAGVDRRSRMFGMEPRHVHDDHGLDAAFQETLVPRQAGEAAFFLDAQAIAGLLCRGIEIIGHGVELVAAVLLEEPRQPRPAATTTDQAQFDLARELRRFCFGRGGIGRENRRCINERNRSAGSQRTPRNWRRE